MRNDANVPESAVDFTVNEPFPVAERERERERKRERDRSLRDASPLRGMNALFVLSAGDKGVASTRPAATPCTLTPHCAA